MRPGDLQRGPRHRAVRPTAPTSAWCGSPTERPVPARSSSATWSTAHPASVAASSELLNRSDVAVIQHEYGLYGGVDGDEVVDIVAGLHVPSIVVAHTILTHPTSPPAVGARGGRAPWRTSVVVMSDAARARLCSGFDVDPAKVVTIPHGAAVPSRSRPAPPSERPTLLTWGLLGPGKGIERVIDAMRSLHDLPAPTPLPGGRTDPPEGAGRRRRGLSQRPHRAGLAQRRGRRRSSFDAAYRDVADAHCADPVVRRSSSSPTTPPIRSTSGVLVDAIAAGRPVVATAFPHAVELLDQRSRASSSTTTIPMRWRPPCTGC